MESEKLEKAIKQNMIHIHLSIFLINDNNDLKFI